METLNQIIKSIIKIFTCWLKMQVLVGNSVPWGMLFGSGFDVLSVSVGHVREPLGNSLQDKVP